MSRGVLVEQTVLRCRRAALKAEKNNLSLTSLDRGRWCSANPDTWQTQPLVKSVIKFYMLVTSLIHHRLTKHTWKTVQAVFLSFEISGHQICLYVFWIINGGYWHTKEVKITFNKHLNSKHTLFFYQRNLVHNKHICIFVSLSNKRFSEKETVIINFIYTVQEPCLLEITLIYN